MANVNEAKFIFPPVHHIGVVVKDLEQSIKDVQAFGMSRAAHPRMPAWLEKLLFTGKTFDTRYKFLGMGSFIHPMMYKIIEVGPDFADPTLIPLKGDALYRGKPLKGAYKIFKIWLGNKILELLQPGKGESPWRETLETKGEGFQHIAFNVRDLEGVTERLKQQGATTILYARLVDGTGGDYLDLGHGLWVEIFKDYY